MEPVFYGISTLCVNEMYLNNGADRWPMRIPYAGIICIAIGTSFLACAAIFILVFRNVLGYLFVDSADVAAAVASICPIAALYQIPDGVLGTIGGVLRRASGQPSSYASTVTSCMGMYSCQALRESTATAYQPRPPAPSRAAMSVHARFVPLGSHDVLCFLSMPCAQGHGPAGDAGPVQLLRLLGLRRHRRLRALLPRGLGPAGPVVRHRRRRLPDQVCPVRVGSRGATQHCMVQNAHA